MSKTKSYNVSVEGKASSKLSDYVQLVKLKLSLLVVFTSIMSFWIVAGTQVNLVSIALLAVGGFLVTGAANALNQVLEKEFDVNMTRTANRPLATNRMSVTEAVMFAGISCLIGISMLSMFNPLAGFLAMLSFVSYAFVYTPLKRYSTIAVAVGALPGALPVLIGAVAFEGSITVLGFGLFMLQFLWQFPHFWAIGFLGFDDYKNAGYKLMPEEDGKVHRSLGLHAAFYCVAMVPVIAWMFMAGGASAVASVIVVIVSAVYLVFSLMFHKQFDRKSALKLMFYSFIYLPAILAVYLIF